MDPAEYLPVELLRRIIEVAPSLDDGKIPQQRAAAFRTLLCSLSLVSHTWLEVSRTFLYSDIIISEESCMQALVRTFAEQPERAALCRRFQLQGDDGREASRKRAVEKVLKSCFGLKDLEVDGARNPWPNAWNALLAKRSILTLKLHAFTITECFATMPFLRSLTLGGVFLPLDVTRLASAFPNISELSITLYGAPYLDSDAEARSRTQFVLAVAPQLETLRLSKVPRTGLPISLIQHILAVSIHLRRFDMHTLIDYKPLPKLSAVSPTLSTADLLPIHLGFIFSQMMRSSAERLPASVPPYERLWAVFDSPVGGAVAAVSAMRRVKQVMLEPWLKEKFPDGVEYAVEKMKQKGYMLAFDTRDPFALDW